MSEHVHADDADLLQWRLDPTGLDRAVAASAAGCAFCSARADELAEAARRTRAVWLESSGTALASDARAARLAERVLELSTRASPGLRGDVSLVIDFVRERLRMSLALRVAAASLAIHLAAFPLLAWYVLRGDARRGAFETSIEPPPAPELPQPSEPPRVPEITEPEPDARLVETSGVGWARGGDAARAARLADRARLLRKDVPDLTHLDAPADPVARMLWARSLRIHRGKLDDTVLAPHGSPDPLANAIATDVLLDHWALAGERAPALDARLHELERTDDADPALSALASAALERARRYAQPDTAGERSEPVDPLGEAWFRALAAACKARGSLAGDAAVRAWTAGE